MEEIKSIPTATESPKVHAKVKVDTTTEFDKFNKVDEKNNSKEPLSKVNTKAKVDTTEFDKFLSPWKNQNEEFFKTKIKTFNSVPEGGDGKNNVKGGQLRRSDQFCDLTEQGSDPMKSLKGSSSVALIRQSSETTSTVGLNNSKLLHNSVADNSVQPPKSVEKMDDSRRLFDSTKDIPSLIEPNTCAIITDAELSGWKFICDSCNSQVFQSFYQGQPVLVKSFDVYRSLEEEETLIDFEFEVETLAKAKHHHIAKALARSATINDTFNQVVTPSIVPFASNQPITAPLHTLFIVMEHVVTTGTLASALESGLLDNSAKYSFSRLLLFAKDLATAVSYMHHDLNRKG